MNDNIHHPARIAGETPKEYRARQAKSKAARHVVRVLWDAGRGTYFADRNFDKRKKRPARDTGQHPVFAAQRVHKQRKHPLRDQHGAYSHVGRNQPVFSTDPWHAGMALGWKPGRRIWLAGISAQRGY